MTPTDKTTPTLERIVEAVMKEIPYTVIEYDTLASALRKSIASVLDEKVTDEEIESDVFLYEAEQTTVVKLKRCPICGNGEFGIMETPSPDKTITFYKLAHKAHVDCGISLTDSDKHRLVSMWNNAVRDRCARPEWVKDAYKPAPTYDEFSKVLDSASFESTWDYFVNDIHCECDDPKHGHESVVCLKCLKPL